MEQLFKTIFQRYFEEEYYSNNIHQDKEYKETEKNLFHQLNELKTLLQSSIHDETKTEQILDDLEQSYLTLSDIYRYHDFLNGLSIGIALTTISPCINNTEFIKEIYSIINKP